MADLEVILNEGHEGSKDDPEAHGQEPEEPEEEEKGGTFPF